MELLDVLIAGAGPAGVATAVGLVRAGVDPARVLCLDRARFPRPKPCGGGLTGRAEAGLAHLGLTLRVPSFPCTDGRVVFGCLQRTVPLPRPVRVVRREDFDADLVAQARAVGVKIEEGEGLADFTVEGASGRVVATTTQGRTLQARVLVGADGAGSVVRRRLAEDAGAERRRQDEGGEAKRHRLDEDAEAKRHRRAIEIGGGDRQRSQPLRLARLELPAPAHLRERPQMIFDFSPLANGLRGYVWVFPVPGDRINVGIMHYPASELGGRALDDLLIQALARHGVTLPRPARGWPTWPYAPARRLSAPHVLCVGDAAGIDALTGEGIAVGLEQGAEAAQEIASALSTGDHRFATFGRRIRKAVVGRELALDRRLARMLYASGDPLRWLSLVLFDPRVLQLYAARVSGSLILADQKPALLGALARHFLLGRRRRRALDTAAAESDLPGAAAPC